MSWRSGPLKHWLSVNDSGVWGEDPDGVDDVEVLRSTDIALDGSWDIDEPAVRAISAVERASKSLRPGDLVVVKSSGSEAHLGKTAIVTPDVAERRACFANFVQRLRPSPSADSRYVWYVLNSKRASDEMAVLGNTSTGLRNLNGTIIGQVTFPGPPLAEQRTIADYLDTETARIDALIAKKLRLRDLLLERSKVAFDAMTATAARRVPLKRITDFREGPGVLAEDFREVGVPLLRIAGLRDGKMTSEGCNYLDPDAVRRRWSHLRVRSDDLVISASASMGVAGFVTDDADGAVPYTGLIRFRQESSDVDLRYVRFFLESRDFMNQIDVMKTGTAIQHFGPTHLSQVSIPLVDPTRQGAVVRGLERLHAKASAATDALDLQIELLREHRQALITAAVTGELEIPEVAP